MSARAFQRGRRAWPRRAVTCEADGSLRTVKRVDLARAERVRRAMDRVDRRTRRRERTLEAHGYTLAWGWKQAGAAEQGWTFAPLFGPLIDPAHLDLGRPVVDTVPL